jgi:hydrogenase nickel insertion protein HypA
MRRSVHEASAVEAIIATALAEAAAIGSPRVRRIDLVAGESSGYMYESLEFYFRTMTRGGPLENTTLAVRYVQALLRCPSCGESFARSRFSFACPRCAASGVMTSVGTEFYIESMEVDDPPEPDSAIAPGAVSDAASGADSGAASGADSGATSSAASAADPKETT